jgi:hypothetical protein
MRDAKRIIPKGLSKPELTLAEYQRVYSVPRRLTLIARGTHYHSPVRFYVTSPKQALADRFLEGSGTFLSSHKIGLCVT